MIPCKTLWPIALILLVPACSFLDPGPYALNDGWRPGSVVAVSTAESLPQYRGYDCRSENGTPYPADTKMAAVTYRSNRMERHRVLPVPEELSLKSGDIVYLNVRRCENSLVMRPQS